MPVATKARPVKKAAAKKTAVKKAPVKRVATNKTVTRPKTVAPCTVPNADLRRVLSDALIFAGHDEVLPTIAAVHVSCDGEQLTVRGTDRYRLAQITLPVDHEGFDQAAPFNFLLSRRDVTFLLGVLKPTRGNDGDWQGKAPVVLTVDGDRLTALREGSGSIPCLAVTFKAVGGEYPIFGKILDGLDKGKLDAGATSVTFAVNPQFVADFAKLGCIGKTGSLQFEVRHPTKPIRVTSPDAPEFLGLIMPVRLAA